MEKVKAMLRKTSAKYRHTGGNDARDGAHRNFLRELSEVYTLEAIRAFEEDQISALYIGWANCVLAGMPREARFQALIHYVRSERNPFTMYAALVPKEEWPSEDDTLPTNVKSLF